MADDVADGQVGKAIFRRVVDFDNSAIMPDGKVHGVTADTADEAQEIADDIIAELAKARMR